MVHTNHFYEIRRPLLARGHQAARDGKPITDLLSQLFFNIPSPVYQSLQVSIDKSAVDPSAGDQSAVCRSAGQQSGIGNCSTVPPGPTIYLPPGPLSQLGVVQKINEISINLQDTQKSPNWSPKTSRSVQNEVQIGA